MKRLLAGALLSVFALTGFANDEKPAGHDAAAKAEHPHWGYKGKVGPRYWGDLNPEFATCKTGKHQSPIDIRDVKHSDTLPEIAFSYQPSPAEVVNNGHSVQVNLAKGGSVKLASGEYQLLQFHFHSPSEEIFEGVSFPLEAHFVHKNADGKLAVIGVFFKKSKKDNPVLAKIFDVMPAEEGGKVALPADFNPMDLFPESKGYYSYTGSLTTPPCSEDVQWQIMKTPVEVSKKQLKLFNKLYKMNARSVQPINDRVIEAK